MSGAADAPPRRMLTAAAALVALEGAALIVVSVVYGVSVHDNGHGVSAWGAAVFGVVCGALVAGVLARAVRRGSRSAVAPTVLLQLICLGEAFNMAQESVWPAAAATGLVAAATLVALGLGARELAADDLDD